MQYGFLLQRASVRTGCKTCVLACKDLHDLPSSIAFRQVYEYGGGSWWRQPDGTVTQDTFCYYVSVACNHCGNPPACACAPPVPCTRTSEARVGGRGPLHRLRLLRAVVPPIARRRWIATPAAR